MSCDHELANEWARCRGKNASDITIEFGIQRVDECERSTIVSLEAKPSMLHLNKWKHASTIDTKFDSMGTSLLTHAKLCDWLRNLTPHPKPLRDECKRDFPFFTPVGMQVPYVFIRSVHCEGLAILESFTSTTL